jgi:chloramphenicol O-acetyltransferase type A
MPQSTTGIFTMHLLCSITHLFGNTVDKLYLSHAAFPDSCPKISFGKMTVSKKRTMPMSIHVHHGLMDGLHLDNLDYFQEIMNQ